MKSLAETHKVVKSEQPAYDIIERDLRSWMQALDDENSEANLYGLTMVDAVYCIHRKLKERGL